MFRRTFECEPLLVLEQMVLDDEEPGPHSQSPGLDANTDERAEGTVSSRRGAHEHDPAPMEESPQENDDPKDHPRIGCAQESGKIQGPEAKTEDGDEGQ